MTDDPDPKDSPSRKVGRNSPPKHTRFRKGVSGNPKGRPRGSKNWTTYLREAARARVTATVNGKSRQITKLQATTMQLATKAAGGDQAAINKFLDWIDEIETRARAAIPDPFPLSEADIEVIHAIYNRMKTVDQETED